MFRSSKIYFSFPLLSIYIIILVINLYNLFFLIILSKLMRTLSISIIKIKLFHSKIIDKIKVIINKIIAFAAIFIKKLSLDAIMIDKNNYERK